MLLLLQKGNSQVQACGFLKMNLKNLLSSPKKSMIKWFAEQFFVHLGTRKTDESLYFLRSYLNYFVAIWTQIFVILKNSSWMAW